MDSDYSDEGISDHASESDEDHYQEESGDEPSQSQPDEDSYQDDGLSDHGMESDEDPYGDEEQGEEEEEGRIEREIKAGEVEVTVGPSLRNLNDGNPIEPICSICFDPWTPDGPHRVCCIPCGHLFGRSCLEEWVQRCGGVTAKCPYCNRKFKLRQIINVHAPVVAVRYYEFEKELCSVCEQNKLLQVEAQIEQEIAQSGVDSSDTQAIADVTDTAMDRYFGRSSHGRVLCSTSTPTVYYRAEVLQARRATTTGQMQQQIQGLEQRVTDSEQRATLSEQRDTEQQQRFDEELRRRDEQIDTRIASGINERIAAGIQAQIAAGIAAYMAGLASPSTHMDFGSAPPPPPPFP